MAGEVESRTSTQWRTLDTFDSDLPGDVVLVDRGFDVADSVAYHGVTLDIPAFTKGRDQLSAEDVEATCTRKLANVRNTENPC